ncbi:Uma2 family endonuclease [Streptomyces sporangiiformans]|uniref:Uma2 family endonuclease n=1 Tax=Streptomyces sporangiiformans TaxID=2315329 RepID=UPI0030B8706F
MVNWRRDLRESIVVSPWPPGYYTLVMERICDQLRPHLPKDHRITSSPLLYVFHEAERAHGPDIHATHRRTWETTSNRMDGQSLSFVAELTQPSTRDDDMTSRVTTYGSAGVPVYPVQLHARHGRVPGPGRSRRQKGLTRETPEGRPTGRPSHVHGLR